MSQAPDFTPPIDAGVENEFLLFDFGRVLATDITIDSAVVTCTVSRGIDPDAATRVIGSADLVPSRTTGVDSCAVQQKVGAMVGGVVYVLQCVVETSDDQSLSLWSRLECVTPA